ncbi:hypothetical protein B0J11DRAFT_615002 [Dendryphion nanum]|uniref:Secreted protein n=1 Tax=Dendryphion nanum TaxID=256645 RepID=A0A9P9DV75_9PLEO|nr:hypothetical protein B0J11DRAFT_615002 [Dendryphion nanum]
MILAPSSLLAGLAVLPVLVLSAPTAVAGSKHTVYLSTCTTTDCLLPILCEEDSFRAAVYFANGPIAEGSTRISTPTSVGTTTGNWEGAKRSARLGTAGTFSVNLPTTAKTAAKGSIAGEGTLGDEPFVCFKDGATDYKIRYSDERYNCKVDYYCPSYEV